MKRLILLACSALGVMATTASADPLWLYDRSATGPQTASGFYAGLDFSGGVQMLPRFKSPFTIHSGGVGSPATSTLSFDPELKGAQPGGVVGYIFRDGTFPAFFGQRVRLEFSGQYVTMTGRKTADRSQTPPGSIVWAGIGGLVLSNAGAITATVREELRVERDGFNLRLAMKSQWALGPNLSLSPAIGVFGGQISDTYQQRLGEEVAITGLSSVGGITERIRTREIGGDIGAALNWQAWPGIGVQIGGSVGVVHLRSRLNGEDCFTAAVLFALFTPCGPGLLGAQTSSVADRRSATGFRGTANVAVNLDARVGILTVGGYFRYDSHVPGVDNLQASAALPAGSTALGSARIRFSGDFGYGGFLRFVMPLQVGVGL